MAVLKVSDLSSLPIDIAYNNIQLENSLYEISYPKLSVQNEFIQYQSMSITHKFLRDSIISGVTSEENSYFYVPKHFLDTTYFHNGIDISGSLCVNVLFSDEFINDGENGNGFIFHIRESSNKIVATGNGGNATNPIKGNNILSANNINELYSRNGTKIYDTIDSSGNPILIADFKKSNVTITENVNKFIVNTNTNLNNSLTVNLSSTFNGPAIFNDNIFANKNMQINGDLTCNSDLTCNGIAYFKNDINGCCLSAKWADLAELYESDEQYKPGTLVKFGGEYEITLADTDVNAVITMTPGVVLNSNISANTYVGIALTGRTPVLVDGPCKKFDNLYLSMEKPGYATTKKHENQKIIGKALKTKLSDIPELVECVVQMKF